MKKVLSILALIIIIFADKSNAFQLPDDFSKREFPEFPTVNSEEFRPAVQKCIDILREDDVDRRLYIRLLLVFKGKKEIIPILIDNLNDNDTVFVAEIETFIFRLTGQGLYGICVGNKEGIDILKKWWANNSAGFLYPDSVDFQYKEYGTECTSDRRGDWFINNGIIKFWRSIKNSNIKIPKYPQDNPLGKQEKVVLDRLLNRVGDNDSFVSTMAYNLLDFIGKPVIPYFIDKLEDNKYEEAIESYLKYNAGIEIENAKSITEIKQKYKEWWDKEGKKYQYIINRNNKDKEKEYFPYKPYKVYDIKTIILRLKEKDKITVMRIFSSFGEIAEGLQEADEKELVTTLLQLMQDKDDDIRKDALSAFSCVYTPIYGRTSDNTGLAELIRAVNDESTEVQLSAIRALEVFKEEDAALTCLVQALKSNKSEIRDWAGRIIYSIAFVTEYDNTKHPTLEGTAKHNKLKRAIPELETALKDKDRDVSSSAAYALGVMGPESFTALLGAAKNGNSSAIMALQNTSFSALLKPVLPDLILIYEKNPEWRRETLELLSKCGKEAIPTIAEGLKDNVKDVKMNAIVALDRFGIDSIKYFPIIVELLEDKNDYVVDRAITFISDMYQFLPEKQKKQAVSVLLNKLKVSDYRFSNTLYEGFGKMGATAIPELIKAIKEVDEKFQIDSIRSLGCIKPSTPEVVALLISLLKDKNENIRYWAAASLGNIGPGGKEAIPALIQALNDPDFRVRCRVIEAIDKIGIRNLAVIEALEKALSDNEGTVATNAGKMLVDLGDDGINIMNDILKLKDSRANDVLYSIRKIKPLDPIFLPTLIEILNGPDNHLKYFCIEIIRNIQDARTAIPTLILILGDKDTVLRSSAALTLKKIGKDVLPALIENLKRKDENTRVMTLKLLSDKDLNDGKATPYIMKMLDNDVNANIMQYIYETIAVTGSNTDIKSAFDKIKINLDKDRSLLYLLKLNNELEKKEKFPLESTSALLKTKDKWDLFYVIKSLLEADIKVDGIYDYLESLSFDNTDRLLHYQVLEYLIDLNTYDARHILKKHHGYNGDDNDIILKIDNLLKKSKRITQFERKP